MHREPRGAGSAEIASREVRLYVSQSGRALRIRRRGEITVSAHVFRVKEIEGRFLSKHCPKRSGTAFLTPSRYFGAEAFSCIVIRD